VAPLAFFFRRWPAHAAGPRHLILAARSAGQLARAEVVAAPGVSLLEATDDGTRGVRGNAVDALRGLLDGALKGARAAVYAAGPEPMMEAAARLARERGLPCRVSLENRMACGVGVCRSCVVDGCAPHPKTGLLRRTVCQDGPVFDPAALAGAWSA
ncbi:MAG: dihydroorotate dehydrogenase electron transfer subunit, partial [Planctomycetota bacterium]|nr:dihydroorotate dehydrogenase electron transfer subunit [Planctomycetota bacterium]